MLRVTQEELVYDTLQELLDGKSEDPPPVTIAEEIAAYKADDPACHETVTLTAALLVDIHVYDDQREHLVDREVLLSWGELLDKFDHCFPSVARLHDQITWGVYQHALHQLNEARYHYWGTETRYPAISRGGIRRRRDMIRISGLGGQHLAEIVCFVRARLPTTSTCVDTTTNAREVSALLPDLYYLKN